MIGCNGSTVEDPQLNGEVQSGQQEVDIEWVSVAQEGISFQFDKLIADSVNISIMAPDQDFFEEHPLPGHLHISFNKPSNGDNISIFGQLNVYPVDQLLQFDPEAGFVIDNLVGMLDSGSTEALEWEMPFLPFQYAGQLFNSNVKIVSFKNGKGIRYLTQHVQDVAPLLNTSLVYTFQGLTADRLYYVSLIMPVNHPELTDTWDEFFADIEYSDFYENFEVYIANDRNLLNNSPDSLFNPPLTLLDQLVESIMVDNPDFLLENEDMSVG